MSTVGSSATGPLSEGHAKHRAVVAGGRGERDVARQLGRRARNDVGVDAAGGEGVADEGAWAVAGAGAGEGDAVIDVDGGVEAGAGNRKGERQTSERGAHVLMLCR
jgi:hypothetical protein